MVTWILNGLRKGVSNRVLRSWLVRYGLFVLAWFGVVLGTSPQILVYEWTQCWSELPLLLLCYAFFQLPLRQNRYRGIVAALPLVWLYVIHDAVLVSIGNVLCFRDLTLLPEVARHVSWLTRLAVLTALIIPPCLWLIATDWRARWWQFRNLPMALGAMLWLFMVFAQPSRTYAWMNLVTPDEEWSDRATAER